MKPSPGSQAMQKRNKAPRKKGKQVDPAALARHPAVRQSGISSGAQQQVPLSFPTHLLRPADDFLRNEPPFRESFDAALKTSYLGLVVDPPSTIDPYPLTETLQRMQDRRFFQTDVTQPFGLGTKCAKTYVTRCLVGDPGTTYKYLGLRMFAYSWNRVGLCQTIGHFKDRVLVPRTREHLQLLHQQRRRLNCHDYNVQRSRPQYNICLINRMDSSRDDYKLEPTFMNPQRRQDDDDIARIAVAWHADSSLEHYSTIAVHQVVLPDGGRPDANEWNLAVRTTPNAEGPNITCDHPPDPAVPPLALSLPSGSTYYMLDDFNHHHQHAVLKKKKNTTAKNDGTSQNSSSSVRYSATYRLLRPSHTAQELLRQCRSTVGNFHKKGIKVWRSEQLLLNALESEWLRQFYIQGQHHRDGLWPDWGEFIAELWKYWELLERRTRFVVELLTGAAHAKGGTATPATNPIAFLSKAERKVRDKQRKAWTQIQELLARSGEDGEDAPLASLYQPMADLLQERFTLRAQWKKREKDHAFTTMEHRYRPLSWPVRFANSKDDNDTRGGGTMAVSPLPEDLSPVVDQLVACGKAYQSGKASELPIVPILTPKGSFASTDTDRTVQHKAKAEGTSDSAKIMAKNKHKNKRQRNEALSKGTRNKKHRY